MQENDTYKGYESKIRNHIIPQIGKKKLSTPSIADVQKLYNKVFKKSKSVARVIKVIVGTSMKYALDSLFIRVCNSKENKGLLKNVPHVEIEDMAVTCHILVSKDIRGVASTPVTNDMVRMYGIREEQLFDDALESSPKVNPPEIVNMDELLAGMYREQYEMMGYDEEEIAEMLDEMPHAAIPMIVVTNEDRINGAATMFYPGIMDEIGEKLKGNFFVLPSFLHETIVVPDDGKMDFKELLAMVTEINATQVDTQDKLTDQVYHYDVTDKVFEKASRYEDRKQEKDKSHEKKSVLEKLEEKKDEAKAAIGAKKTSYRDAVSL